MKVLYIAHYREKSGWANAAKDHILALDKAGVDVVCRNVTLTGDKQIGGRLLELEQKSSQGCDVCIQHVLPHHLVGTKAFRKNIAFVETEAVSIKDLPWFDMLKQMDEVWVPNNQMQRMFELDDLNVKTHVVPHPCNIEKYSQTYRDLSIPPAAGKFKFYYIGDINARKNIEAIVTCFHSEFTKSDNVALVLKIDKFGRTQDQIRTDFDQFLLQIKSSLRLYPTIDGYMKDITIIGDMPDDDIMAIHRFCDCYVSPSHGEAWSIPAFDAMAFGNTPICSDFGGPSDFITNDQKTGQLVNGTLVTCRYSDPAFPDMFTGREYWYEPSHWQIRHAMRSYYEAWTKDALEYKRSNQAVARMQANKFSYDAIGAQMEGLLSE